MNEVSIKRECDLSDIELEAASGGNAAFVAGFFGALSVAIGAAMVIERNSLGTATGRGGEVSGGGASESGANNKM